MENSRYNGNNLQQFSNKSVIKRQNEDKAAGAYIVIKSLQNRTIQRGEYTVYEENVAF